MSKTEKAMSGTRTGLTVKRYFTTAGVHPYDEIEWDVRDAVIPNFKEGGNAFEQRGVEFPTSWSQNATNIVAQKYFRGPLGTPQRERTVRQLIDRVADTVTSWGSKDGYFATEEDRDTFNHELKHILVTQKAAFNSPVWFNVGVEEHPQCSACFILAVDDTMSAILNWYVEEGTIFKGGSGSGINLSNIRSSKEQLSAGGEASGPVSFMRGADASAGTIKSGGKTRRAAKMVVLNVDHPDVQDFIWCKALEERKARVLRDGGFDMDLDGRDAYSIQYQNANNSVRVTDEFMKAYTDDGDWSLRAVLTGEPIKSLRARDLMREIAQTAWECADPGMQYDTTINDWHTCPASGRINASNPCSEYMHLDNSACNLASMNLLKFVDASGTFDVAAYRHAIDIVFLAQEILVGNSSYPTPKIGQNAIDYRELGLGYANLGALLMSRGVPYDSDAGRAWAAAITALMTGWAYRDSALYAEQVGPFNGFSPNRDAMLNVIRKHRAAVDEIDAELVPEAMLTAAKNAWDEAITLGAKHGFRNSQASVLAPTGTIGLMMDCDTTGIEPDLALVKTKKLVGGGTMRIVNQTIPRRPRSSRSPRTSTNTTRLTAPPTSRRSTARCSTARWGRTRSTTWVT
jgi:ribonucleoside-diphosphate reductase alpha chain